MDIHLSPHTLQNKNAKYSDKFVRILTDEFPEKKYVPKEKDQDRTSVHFGQRKLFLSEVEFLTNCCFEIPKEKMFKKIILIYAGAAPGLHLEFLSQMFPFIKFVLIDPAKMAFEPTDKIRINQEYFTHEMALDLREEFNSDIILFISDIRRFGPGAKLTDAEIENEILEDMQNQMDWYHILKPFRSLFKFRLPYVENRPNAKHTLDYLEGDIYFQIWPPNSSSETRLYVREKAKLKTYDCLKYENQLYYFNNVERVNCYEHFYDLDGLDHCYDCRAEVFVFENYIKNFNSVEKLCRNGETLKYLTVPEYVSKLNVTLKADERNIIICYNKKEYQLKFTSIKFGKSVEDLLNDNNLVKFKTNKWKLRNHHFDHMKTLSNSESIQSKRKTDSAHSTIVKRLKNN
ncbi:hypothetical protein BpHYR1_053876 [Brachionus plicatilis]|uniref:Cap-specific mRNA (nucleoside-2'-O-)-methyltransferase n=1 Tax=Brachionus plicatilis TaxID=10195 RepID=A0A3M7RW95_BRAPC|nr:hypothetical protein BpHYR1_053876 [Brachionus plicatilis]